jgi:hypothetical protein
MSTATDGVSRDGNKAPLAESRISSEPSSATAALVAPEGMTMEDRLAARAKRFGIEPESNALLKKAGEPLTLSDTGKDTGAPGGRKGKKAPTAATAPAVQDVKDGDHAGKATSRRDRSRAGAEKRERAPEVRLAETLTPEEEAMRAKRAKRFGLTTGSEAQS